MEVDLTQLTGWTRALAECPEKLGHEMIASTNVALHELASASRDHAPVDEGNLKADIRVMKAATRQGGVYTGTVGTDLEYAAQREYGGPIYPRNGQFLVFEVDGELVFARKVEQEGSHFMERGSEEIGQKFDQYYQLGIQRALGDI